jgi:SpoVK/Ycf46/Vps4 family AAA+-type ATPase
MMKGKKTTHFKGTLKNALKARFKQGKQPKHSAFAKIELAEETRNLGKLVLFASHFRAEIREAAGSALRRMMDGLPRQELNRLRAVIINTERCRLAGEGGKQELESLLREVEHRLSRTS